MRYPNNDNQQQNDLERRVDQFRKENILFEPKEKVLLAVSGGVDSVVMSHLFASNQWVFGIAHCNFKLRGNDADEDAAFVEKLAQKLGVPFHTIEFDTQKIASEQGVSIQVAARDLRYDWLQKIAKSHKYEYIATAHHQQDSVETFLYNFTRGAGIKGLLGIPLRNKNIIRPLLFTQQEELLSYAHQSKLSWREDASNQEVKYTRNRIRHQVIPALTEINPAFLSTASENIQRLKEANSFYEYAIQEWKKRVASIEGKRILIDISTLQKAPSASTLLFEILGYRGFVSNQISQILTAIGDGHAGKQFFSPSHELLIDRESLLVQPIEKEDARLFYLNKKKKQVDLPNGQLFIKKSQSIPAHFDNDSSVAWIDETLLKFPLKIRKWQKGDVFHPLGMKGKRQKLSDFFVRQKLSRFDKKNVWIMESDGQIVWIIGYRIDERFKISNETRNCMFLQWIVNI